jgi:hypothetical protein
LRKFVAAIIYFVCVFLAGCGPSWLDDTVPRDKIFSYVNANYELLENFPYNEIQEIDYSSDSYEINQKKEINIIRKNLANDTIVKSVFAYNENIIQYYCGGSGFVGGSTYTGFYFSKNDTPFALEFDGCELTEIQSDVFEWQNEDGSHKIHTEKIRDNWYYYRMDYY